jgi:predicted DNA-binding transcriptional regulator YafY
MDNARVVTGWCELRKAFRFFRTDRISSAEICDRYPARRADLIRDFYAQLSDELRPGLFLPPLMLTEDETEAWRRGSLLTGTDSGWRYMSATVGTPKADQGANDVRRCMLCLAILFTSARR